MKRVLVLAFYFPPLGGAGVQRTVKLLKHLDALGYEAVVVTGPEDESLGWAPPDETLLAEVPASCRVVRIAQAPTDARSLGAKAARWLARPSARERWWRARAAAAAAGVDVDVDLVYASMSPFGSAEVADGIASRLGVPWVADLRDPWALDDWAIYPSALHRQIELRRMRRALQRADAIVLNVPEARAALLEAFPELSRTRLAVVPNGWDADDFGPSPPSPDRGDGSFRIVYTGYAHVAAGLHHRRTKTLRRVLGGSVRGMDILSRSHLFLVEALGLVAQRDPALAERVELHVAGAGAWPAAPGDDGVPLVHHGYLPHDEAIGLMRSADLLFLPMQDLPEGVRTRTVPGKTYEYLASGRPILAALPDGDARDLLAPLPDVHLCRPTAVECMADAVAAAAASPPTGATAPPDLLARLERQHLAGEIAGLFDEVLAGRATAASSGTRG